MSLQGLYNTDVQQILVHLNNFEIVEVVVEVNFNKECNCDLKFDLELDIRGYFKVFKLGLYD